MPESSVVRRRVGAAIRRERLQRSLSKDDVALALETTVADVDRLEDGAARATPSQLFGLSYLFDVPIRLFFQAALLERDLPPGSLDLNISRAVFELDEDSKRVVLAVANSLGGSLAGRKPT